MPLMHWDESMSVGDTSLDDQHKKLITIINESFEAVRQHDEREISNLIDKMRDYAALHFAVEEEYMRTNGFPSLEAHKKMHEQFNEEVDEFRRNRMVKTNLSQIFIYLSRWLTNHIMDKDKEYMLFMEKKQRHSDQP